MFINIFACWFVPETIVQKQRITGFFLLFVYYCVTLYVFQVVFFFARGLHTIVCTLNVHTSSDNGLFIGLIPSKASQSLIKGLNIKLRPGPRA